MAHAKTGWPELFTLYHGKVSKQQGQAPLHHSWKKRFTDLRSYRMFQKLIYLSNLFQRTKKLYARCFA